MKDSIVEGAGKSLGILKKAAIGAGAAVLAVVLFNGAFVYNEAGYQTHIRTITGSESVVSDVGWAWKGFGRATPWKQAQTVQFVLTKKDSFGNPIESEIENIDERSGTVVDYKVVFIGNVDSDVEASTRFRLPQGDQFLKIAQEYRTPDNFVATALTPAIKETLQATASLMTADDYFAGARSEFGSEFENQLRNGQYIVKRKEVSRDAVRKKGLGVKLVDGVGEEEGSSTTFVTEKILDVSGVPVRKKQHFIAAGVEVVEARITNVVPNDKYRERMKKVQDSLADLAVDRQNRLREEEAKLLSIAKGERMVEEKRQETLRDQAEQTTNAETKKRLAIIEAERERERAEIEKKTAALKLERAEIDAKATKTAADAEAYAKKAVIMANGALEQKLAALVDINKAWADAASRAPVSGVVMGGTGDGQGRQSEIQQLMGVMAVKAAKDLQLDMGVQK